MQRILSLSEHDVFEFLNFNSEPFDGLAFFPIHGQGTSKLSSINPKLVTPTSSNSSSLHLETTCTPICSWIFSSLNIGRILARFLNESSKHSGSVIPSLTKNTYGITLILPNQNIFIWMVPLLAKTPGTQHISTLHLFSLFQEPSTITKIMKVSLNSSPPVQHLWPHYPLEPNHPLLHWNVSTPLHITKSLNYP